MGAGTRPLRAQIDLNADLGEGFADAELMPFLTSCNVACGAHAGDAATMRATVRLALHHGVAIGAHPSFPDREGFGRRVITRDPAAIEKLVAEQIARLAVIAAAEGATLTHVKPHGALYNLAAVDERIALAIARAVQAVEPPALLFALAGSRGLEVARARGIEPVAEGFVDRGYQPDRTLAPRGEPGALIEDPETAAARALALVERGVVRAVDGGEITLEVDTLCLHGDTPRAREIAERVATALRTAGIVLAPPAPRALTRP